MEEITPPVSSKRQRPHFRSRLLPPVCDLVQSCSDTDLEQQLSAQPVAVLDLSRQPESIGDAKEDPARDPDATKLRTTPSPREPSRLTQTTTMWAMSSPLKRVHNMISGLKTGRRPRIAHDLVKRRVTRKGGIADTVADAVVDLIEGINEAQGLQLFPLTEELLISRLSHGKELQVALKSRSNESAWANQCKKILGNVGPACKSAVIAMCTAPDLDAHTIAEAANVTDRWVRVCRSKHNDKNFFNSGKRKGEGPHAASNGRKSVPASEQAAVREFMLQENPARSGDTQPIAWMSKGRTDFYFEDYRSARGQLDIIAKAVNCPEHGEELRRQASANSKLTCRWLKNVSLYLLYQSKGKLGELKVRRLQCERLSSSRLAREALARMRIDPDEDEDLLPPESPEAGDDCEDSDDDGPMLRPRSYDFFYKVLLKGLPLRKRPPHNFCSRCNDYEVKRGRVMQLTAALSSDPSDVNHESHLKLLESYGGRNAASAARRQLEWVLRDLQKHVEWRETARKYLKTRNASLHGVYLHIQLDYGGFTDSANKKFSAWSATVMSQGREDEHFDFFFDSADAGKNGQTGVYLLHEFIDALEKVFDERHLLLSGDTGNGFRAYLMIDELSKIFNARGFYVELVPLSPGHAWNKTDARIARLNTFFSHAKSVMHLLGAEAFANLLIEATLLEKNTQRKLLTRSHIFYRKIPEEYASAPTTSSEYGAQLVHEDYPGGHIGVRGLLYFQFWFDTPGGKRITPEGFALVREHGDPTRPGNPSRVYTWRKELAKQHCQMCSDEQGYPVLLTVNGCSKRKCSKQAARSRARCSTSHVATAADSEGDIDRCDGQGSPHMSGGRGERGQQPGSNETHQVRAVRYLSEDTGEYETWLYIPAWAHRNNSTCRRDERKCQWLWPDEDDLTYQVGSHIDTIEDGRPDFLVLKDVVFVQGSRQEGRGTKTTCTLTAEQTRLLEEGAIDADAELEEMRIHFGRQDTDDGDEAPEVLVHLEENGYDLRGFKSNQVGGIRFVVRSGASVLCEADGGLSFSAMPGRDEVFLDHMNVVARHARKGHGTNILKICIAWYKRGGTKSLVVTNPSSLGKKLYKKCGFKSDIVGNWKLELTDNRDGIQPSSGATRRRSKRIRNSKQ